MIFLRTSIGIEVRQDDLLISSLQSNFAAGVFTAFARIPDFRSRDQAAVKNEIDQFFRKHRLSRENIILGIPRRDLIVRHLDLPAEVADNLKQVVQYQVQSFEPTEEEKFYFDYALVKTTQGSKRLLVLLVMMRKAILDGYLTLFEGLGIRPVAVTGSTMALSNLFLQSCKEQQGKTFLIADLTREGVEIIALRDGALVYTHAAAVPAGSSFKDVVASQAELAAAKIRLGPDQVIDKVVLNGESAGDARQEIAEVISEAEIMGSRLRFEMTAESQVQLGDAVTSLGLAYSGMVGRPPVKLNLLPSSVRVQQTKWAYVPSIVLGVAIIGLLGALYVMPVIQDRTFLRQLDQEIASLKPRVEMVQKLQKEVEATEKQVIFLEGLLRNRDMNLEILQELTTIFPADTYLIQFQNQEGSITMNGLSPSAEQLIPKLEKSPLLKEVTPRGGTIIDPQTRKDRFNFAAKVER
jgi:Tfp pilus assembly protein PilN